MVLGCMIAISSGMRRGVLFPQAIQRTSYSTKQCFLQHLILLYLVYLVATTKRLSGSIHVQSHMETTTRDCTGR